MSDDRTPAAARSPDASARPGDDTIDADPAVVGFVPVGPDGVPVPLYASPDRPRGLDAEFAPGGEDEASAERRADERRMLRLLVLMVALLVGVPTVLTIIAFVGQLVAARGGG